MDQAQHSAIVNFIWGIADDVLRDVCVRGKYRDVILPMTVIRRLDCLLEPTIALRACCVNLNALLKNLSPFSTFKQSACTSLVS